MKPIAPWWRTRRVGRPSVYARTHLPPLCPVWTGRHASAFILLCFISATCSAVRVNSRLLPDKQTSKVGTKRIPTECKHCVPRDPRRRCRIKFRFSFIHLCSINCLFICSFDVFFLLFLIFLGHLYVYSAISMMMAPDCCSSAEIRLTHPRYGNLLFLSTSLLSVIGSGWEWQTWDVGSIASHRNRPPRWRCGGDR